jgi:hypothetical protein
MGLVIDVRVCPRVPRSSAPSPPDDSLSWRSGVGQAAHTAVTRFDSESPFVVPERSA